MRCGCKLPTEREFYSPKAFPARPPRTISALQTWLGKSWDGKIYVAPTICWNEKEKEFRQRGCSPNYMAGWWTLACCKYDMRASVPFKGNVFDFSKPTYVFTLSECIGGEQALVSVARVTKCFRTMGEYADFLKTRNKKLASSRFSRECNDDGMRGWHFGDCHADSDGRVDRPNSGHVHSRGGKWEADCPEKKQSRDHLILVSNQFIVWAKPAFVKVKPPFKRSRYGVNIDESKLRSFLEEFND